MGIFSFAKDIGDKIFNRDKSAQTTAPVANEPTTTAPVTSSEPSAQQIAELLLARIQEQNVNIAGLKVNYNSDSDTVMLSGTAKTQEDRERARLAVGNVQYVETVVDDIEVETPAEESRFYTVVKGDTLSKIAKEMYGNANDYMKIFDANKPMLSHPDKIYVGQVLRIPA
ncbi:peptidoglycan-binding protein LysM [Moraxella pluranimalium]|uniref:Potassium binding protein Kbp n=1 Tax=Moraxella pluranimalium TaxID=470453 RepID=A0A1T0CIA6_9GAMM|nr:peptidoglycan-binding protein LysM [Moraxella pluranimalium]OOS22096.1 peptidoglycan-binding protein LysM [Moraxella pluranimalium]